MALMSMEKSKLSLFRVCICLKNLMNTVSGFLYDDFSYKNTFIQTFNMISNFRHFHIRKMILIMNIFILLKHMRLP